MAAVALTTLATAINAGTATAAQKDSKHICETVLTAIANHPFIEEELVLHNVIRDLEALPGGAVWPRPQPASSANLLPQLRRQIMDSKNNLKEYVLAQLTNEPLKTLMWKLEQAIPAAGNIAAIAGQANQATDPALAVTINTDIVTAPPAATPALPTTLGRVQIAIGLLGGFNPVGAPQIQQKAELTRKLNQAEQLVRQITLLYRLQQVQPAAAAANPISRLEDHINLANLTQNQRDDLMEWLKTLETVQFIYNAYDFNGANFATDLGTARTVVDNSEKILRTINIINGPKLDAADQAFVTYMTDPEFIALPESQKKVVRETIFNLFKNQMYLIAIVICQNPSMARFARNVLEKLKALNIIKQYYAQPKLNAPGEQMGGAQQGGQQLMHKCLYKAHKHMYFIGKQL
jgi:hypothetical protein